MTEHCPDHHQLVENVGKIAGNVERILDMQKEIKDNVAELFSKYNDNHVDSAVQKTKVAPIFWSLAVIGGYLLIDLVKEFIKR
jgi:hypothetical protein